MHRNRKHHPHHHGRRYARDTTGLSGGSFGPRGGRHHGGRAGHRSELGRFFAHGDLRLVILHLIAEKPRHGYEVIKAIEDSVAGAYSPSPGTIYPALTLLEELGHVTVSASEGTKKLHTITPEGRAFLEGNRPAVDALLARMAAASTAAGDGPPASIIRGMENLKLALRLRLVRGSLTAEQATAITATLDAAAVAIEQA